MTVVETKIKYSRLYDDLKRGGRENFTYFGAYALMEHLDEQDEVYEYRPVDFCCDWKEYENLAELVEAYSNTLSDREDFDSDEEYLASCLDEIQSKTEVISFTGYNTNYVGYKGPTSYLVRVF